MFISISSALVARATEEVVLRIVVVVVAAVVIALEAVVAVIVVACKFWLLGQLVILLSFPEISNLVYSVILELHPFDNPYAQNMF